MIIGLKRAGLAAVAVMVLAAGAVAAQPAKPAPAKKSAPQCFRSSDWRGWKATPDGAAMYIEAGIKRVYRLDLAQPCRELNDIGAVLITRSSSSYICQPIDVDMRVSRPGIGISWCQVRKITRLSADEAKALPKKLQP